MILPTLLMYENKPMKAYYPCLKLALGTQVLGTENKPPYLLIGFSVSLLMSFRHVTEVRNVFLIFRYSGPDFPLQRPNGSVTAARIFRYTVPFRPRNFRYTEPLLH